MARCSLLLGAWLVCVAAVTGAQSYRNGLIVSDTQGRLYRVSPAGAMTTIGSYATATMPNIWSMVVDNDNRHVIAVASGVTVTTGAGALLRIDPQSGFATTLATVAAPYPIAVDEHGGFLVGSLIGAQYVLLHFDGGTMAVSTVMTASAFPIPARDPTTGDWLVDRTGSGLERHASDFSTQRATYPHPLGWLLAMESDPIGPILYAAAGSTLGAFDLQRNTITSLAAVPQSTPISLDAAIAVDRATDASGGLIHVSRSMPTNLIEVYDRSGTVLRTIGPFPAKVSAIVFDRGRNIAFGVVTAPNHRAIRISIPEDAGKLCVCAISASGYTPGIPIADGRTIPLRPDAVMLLSVTGRLAPLLRGNVDTLDAGGRMVATLDLNPLGNAVAGVPLWVTAVTLDPQASSGVATVTRPEIVVH